MTYPQREKTVLDLRKFWMTLPALLFPALCNHRRHSMFGDDEKKNVEEYNYGLQVFTVETKLSFMSETM